MAAFEGGAVGTNLDSNGIINHELIVTKSSPTPSLRKEGKDSFGIMG